MIKPSTVMLVSADRDTAKAQERRLEAGGVSTILVGDAIAALEIGRAHRPHGVVCAMDVKPAGGLDFCVRFRRVAPVPVLLFAGAYDAFDAEAAHEAGAADYVSRSTSPEEFVARVKAMLRKPQGREERVFRVGEIQVNESSCDVHCAGRPIRTTATEFRILHTLAQSPGRVFSRNHIADAAGQADALERTIDAHIKNIRRKLGPHADALETVRGFGYRIAPQRSNAIV